MNSCLPTPRIVYFFLLKSEPSVLGVSSPSPMAYCTQSLSVLWFALPHHMTSLKVPPPFSLFISSKLFEMRGVSQSQTSFPSTTACLRICQRGLRRAIFFFVRMCLRAQKLHKNFNTDFVAIGTLSWLCAGVDCRKHFKN